MIVSNEVIQDTIFHDKFLKVYGGMLGTLHQEIVERADVAYLVEWGVPVVKKVLIARLLAEIARLMLQFARLLAKIARFRHGFAGFCSF